jgi:hypothetical protein
VSLTVIGAALGALILAIGAAFGIGRRAGTDKAAAQAAKSEQETRHVATDAARAAERDGAADRLRDGRF